MISFSAEILKFGKMGDKTGWTYIEIKQEQAQILFPNNKKSFRFKGTLDEYKIKSVAVYFSKYIESAKTSATKAKRIALTMEAMLKGMSYPEMIRANKELK